MLVPRPARTRGPGQLGDRLSSHLDLAVLAGLLHGLAYLVQGWRWRIATSRIGLRLGVWDSFRLTLVSLGISTCLPGNGAGDLAKGWMVTSSDRPFSRILGTMVIDRWSGIGAMFLSWTIWSAIGWLQGDGLAATARLTFPVATILAILWIGAGWNAHRALGLVGTSRHRVIGQILSGMTRTLEALSETSRHRPSLVRMLGIGLVVQFLVVAVGVVACRILGHEVTPAAVGTLLPATMMGNSLPLSPGGIGVGESIGAAGFARMGMAPATGSEAILLVRLASVCWALPGLVLWGFSRKDIRSS